MPQPTSGPTAPAAKPLYLAAMLSGGLLYASFFPLNFGFLAWIALVPLLFLVHSSARPRHVYLAALVGGLACFIPALQWVRVAHTAMYATWFALALMCSIYFSIGLWWIRWLDRRGAPLPLSVPAVWVGLEYVRAHFPTGFPWLEAIGAHHPIGFGWYFLGYTQHDALPVIQIADFTGVYGASFLVALVNAVVYQWLRRALHAEAPKPWPATVAAMAVIAGALGYGYERLSHAPLENGPRVALLQSNLPQAVKMEDGKFVWSEMMRLLQQALMTPRDEAPDLVVWPETTCPFGWYDVGPGVSPAAMSEECRQELVESSKLAGFMSHAQTNQLVGLGSVELDSADRQWKFNSALLFEKDGAVGPRYDKMHLVPFGEYVPLKDIFPWLQAFTPYTHDYSCKPGEHWTRFPLPVRDRTYQFACVICYEDSDPTLARRYLTPSSEGPPVDFLVNISNDGWFNGTEEHEQHLAICRFRAIECRRSVVRAVNMGISGIIDSDGRIVTLPGPDWSSSKKIATVVNGVVPIDHREALYPRWGDWLPLGCWAMIAAALALSFVRRRALVAPKPLEAAG
jgi:apolipoprotein N-acyltransferase